MARAKSQMDNITASKTSLYSEFFKSPEGKSELEKIRKNYKVDFAVTDEKLISQILQNEGAFKGKSTTAPVAPGSYVPQQVNIPNFQDDPMFKSKLEKWMKSNPDSFPESLRGFTVNADVGHGKVIQDLLVKDLQSGNLKSYLSPNQSDVIYRDQDGKEVDTEIDPASIKLNITSDLGAVTYVITGKDTEGNVISTTLNAPESHKSNLKNMALDMYQKGESNNNTAVKKLAFQIYNISTQGSKASQYAIEDKMNIGSTATPLSKVIDINSSTVDNIRTFSDNIYIKGSPVGQQMILGNQVFQKYKVIDKSGSQKFMLTTQVKDKNGNILYRPIENESGGLYYNSSSDAERFLVETAMRNELPSLIQTSKMDVPNVNLQQAATILQQGIQQNNSLLNEDD